MLKIEQRESKQESKQRRKQKRKRDEKKLSSLSAILTAIALETVLEPYGINMNNISNLQRLELSTIPYYVNQSVDLQL